ncbi:BolA family protein [Buchnera aphidicola]|uniref:BolA family protein n=1 Tax=Buchnera aphidicola TaxID=9 RepID=UPI0031B82A69
MIIKKIKKFFFTQIIKIYDNSIYHRMHDDKKHLSILIVSDDFHNMKMIERHQKIYKLLRKEMKNEIYALSIHTYTMQEWKKKNKKMNHIRCINKNI